MNHEFSPFAIAEVSATSHINSLAPGKFEWNFRHVIFKQILVGWSRHLLWNCHLNMSFDFTDDQSTLVQVMAWCHQATSHYLTQCWPRFLPPYGVTRPQWVKWVIMAPTSTRDLFHWCLMHHNSNLMENLFHSHSIPGNDITTKFAHMTAWLWYHMRKIVAIGSLEFGLADWIFHHIWIAIEKLLV